MPQTSTTRQLTVTIPAELAEQVQAKVASGEFATESDVVRESLSQFVEGSAAPQGMSEPEFENWIRSEALPVLDAMKSDPSLGLSLEQVRANLVQAREAFKKAG